MNKFVVLFICLLGLSQVTSCHLHTQTHAHDAKTKQLANLLTHKLGPAQASIAIESLDGTGFFFEHNSQYTLTPASSIKLVPSISALRYLRASFRYETQLATDDDHNLYLIGSGDPSLQSKDLRELAEILKQTGTHKISGNLIVDSSYFDDIPWGKGWMWDDMQDGYSAPTSGLNVERNQIRIKPLELNPQTNYVIVTTEQSEDPFEVKLESPFGLLKDDKIHVKGKFAQSKLAVRSPALFAGHLLSEHLKELGIKFSGKVLESKAPSTAQIVATHYSATLPSLLIPLLKRSLNLDSECLIKTIAAQQTNEPGTTKAGLEMIKQFLSQEVGLDFREVRIADGSGLSRYNLMSARQMVKLLKYAHHNLEFGSELLSALPKLTSRTTNSTSIVRAKSGSMTGVFALAGFLNNAKDEQFVFTIIFNGINKDAGSYKALLEEILATL